MIFIPNFSIYSSTYGKKIMQDINARPPALLIVDDDGDFRSLVKGALKDEDYEVDDASTGEGAIKASRARNYDLVLLDIKMPVMDGIQALKILRKETPSTDVVMISGYQDLHLAIEAIKLGAKEYLTKPVDTSDLVQRIKSALRAHAAEKRLKELQAEFTSRLLHELRNPVNTVKSAVDFLTKGMAGPLTEQQQDVLSHIENNIGDMAARVNDMIDLNQFESGLVDLEKIPTNLDELLPAVCARLEPQVKSKKLALNVSVDRNVPTLELDPEKIEQAVGNLLENAIKYTGEGGSISVKAAAAQEKSGNQTKEIVEITVADTGIGISKEELPFVFDKYKEFLTGRTSKQKTTGLGLAICRSILTAHNGSVTVESAAGKGSTFTVRLPVD